MTTQIKKSKREKILGWLGLLFSHLLWGVVCIPIGGYLGIFLFVVFPELQGNPPGIGAFQGFVRGGILGFFVGCFCSIMIHQSNQPHS